jgi:hypothetical protein
MNESLIVCGLLQEAGMDVINCSCGTYESDLKASSRLHILKAGGPIWPKQ